MIRIRRVAIIFAVLSATYWEGVAWFWAMLNPLAGIDDVPFWMAAVGNAIPSGFYAIVTLIFCHWLARRVGKQVQERV